jgi:cellobiose phosphorylase
LEDVLTYKVEPYVISADIYGVSPHIGRGGWSWYTGSASWMYRAAIETLLGFKVSKGLLRLKPCLPNEWSGFELTFRRGKTTYEFIVVNHQPEDSIFLDGIKLEESFIPDLDDGLIHQIRINLQSPS